MDNPGGCVAILIGLVLLIGLIRLALALIWTAVQTCTYLYGVGIPVSLSVLTLGWFMFCRKRPNRRSKEAAFLAVVVAAIVLGTAGTLVFYLNPGNFLHATLGLPYVPLGLDLKRDMVFALVAGGSSFVYFKSRRRWIAKRVEAVKLHLDAGNDAEAWKELVPLGDAGYREALGLLGEIFGRKTFWVNPEKARKWCQENAGFAESLHCLGYMYEHNIGEGSLAQALNCYRSAARLGHKEARFAKEAMALLSSVADTSGTLAYMAPEQHQGRQDRRSDLFAFGVMLYEMLVEDLPYRGPDYLPQKLAKTHVLPSEAVKAYESPPRIPGRLDEVVARCLEPDVAARYQSAAAVLADLEGIA